jgi:hypothetical protein
MIQRLIGAGILDQQAAMHDDRDRQLQLGQDRQRGAKTPPGADHHLNSLPDRGLEGSSSAFAHGAVFAQQGAVEIDGHHPKVGGVLLRLCHDIAVWHSLLCKVSHMHCYTVEHFV